MLTVQRWSKQTQEYTIFFCIITFFSLKINDTHDKNTIQTGKNFTIPGKACQDFSMIFLNPDRIQTSTPINNHASPQKPGGVAGAPHHRALLFDEFPVCPDRCPDREPSHAVTVLFVQICRVTGSGGMKRERSAADGYPSEQAPRCSRTYCLTALAVSADAGNGCAPVM